MHSQLFLRVSFAAAGLALVSATSRGQLPGTPALQNAFVNPGITAAVNGASLSGASSYALAGAWAPGSARFQLSAGVGLQTRSGASTRTIYGGRVNIPLLGATSNFGASVFGGYGGLSGGGALDSSVSKSLIPVGATVGYRHSLGASHGVSLYGSPVYEWVGRGGGASTVGVFRGALGLDIGITSSLGATLGLEFGSKQPPDTGKPSGTAFGAALSYALGRGR
jgi:hypothetical protein